MRGSLGTRSSPPGPLAVIGGLAVVLGAAIFFVAAGFEGQVVPRDHTVPESPVTRPPGAFETQLRQSCDWELLMSLLCSGWRARLGTDAGPLGCGQLSEVTSLQFALFADFLFQV